MRPTYKPATIFVETELEELRLKEFLVTIGWKCKEYIAQKGCVAYMRGELDALGWDHLKNNKEGDYISVHDFFGNYVSGYPEVETTSDECRVAEEPPLTLKQIHEACIELDILIMVDKDDTHMLTYNDTEYQFKNESDFRKLVDVITTLKTMEVS